jgi:toxin ParE1/3/4
MNHKIKIKPKAYDDLTQIYQYSLKEFGPAKAAEYIGLMDATFKKLSENIQLGTDYKEISSELKAYLVASHIVFFKRSTMSITVIRVLHQSMDFDRHI